MHAAETAADNEAVNGNRPGHHKVFIGMAAGVGKTYRMLQEGHAEQDAGRDVVIGYMEPHRRAETSALAEGLESISRRQVSYRDTELEEMDLPGLLRRAPDLALIDELAHTNAPGVEHEKRFEDVRDGARGGDRRLLDGQRPAPRVAQRPGHRADRDAGAGDDPRRRARRSRRGRIDRPHPGGTDRAPAGRQDLPRREHRGGAEQLLHRRKPALAARGGAAPGRSGGRGQAPGRRGAAGNTGGASRLRGTEGDRRAPAGPGPSPTLLAAPRPPRLAFRPATRAPGSTCSG